MLNLSFTFYLHSILTKGRWNVQEAHRETSGNAFDNRPDENAKFYITGPIFPVDSLKRNMVHLCGALVEDIMIRESKLQLLVLQRWMLYHLLLTKLEFQCPQAHHTSLTSMRWVSSHRIRRIPSRCTCKRKVRHGYDSIKMTRAAGVTFVF